MPTLLEQVAKTKRDRDRSEIEFRAAMVAAKEFHSWAEIASATGMTRAGCQHVIRSTKGES
jgi:biotin operon repressor